MVTKAVLIFYLSIAGVISFAQDTVVPKVAVKPAAVSTSTVKSEEETAIIKPSQLFSIGSGAVGGNYFVLGQLVGEVISHPIGSLPCGKGGTCGVEGLQSQNVTSAGSIANLRKMANGEVESSFVQSDIAYWAYTATGTFENKDKYDDLRAIASLYPEMIHILVRKDSGITDISQLKEKRVSVGSRKSGTLLGARLVLGAYKISEDDMMTEYLNITQAMEKIKNSELDALFFSVGAPAPFLTQLLAQGSDYNLLSIGKQEQEVILKQGHYFSPSTIKVGTYKGIAEVETISVFALWLTTKSVDESLVYEITKSLWHKDARLLFDINLLGKGIKIENSLNGVGIPLHEGAKKYYNEIGKRF